MNNVGEDRPRANSAPVVEEIEDRWRSLTALPWRWHYSWRNPVSLVGADGIGRLYALKTGAGVPYLQVAEADARALEAAPSDIAALLAALDAAEHEAASLRIAAEIATAALAGVSAALDTAEARQLADVATIARLTEALRFYADADYDPGETRDEWHASGYSATAPGICEDGGAVARAALAACRAVAGARDER